MQSLKTLRILRENLYNRGRAVRKKTCERSFFAFCVYYFGHYITHKFAPFHKDMMKDLQNDRIKYMVEIMFRGSAKSSIISTMFVVWNIVYRKRRFIIIASDVSDSAQTQMDSVINELQNNTKLIRDFGSLYTEVKKQKLGEKKRKTISDFITKNRVRVLMRSTGMKVRGLRYNNIRPELAIVDDPESLETSESETKRRKAKRWIEHELMGGMSQTRRKLVVAGNWLHDACLVAELYEDKRFSGRKVPIILDEGTENERPAWESRYTMTYAEARTINRARRDRQGGRIEPDQMVISIEGLRDDHGTMVFTQEFMLEPLTEENMAIKPYWIHWIDSSRLPSLDDMLVRIYLDPAVGQDPKKHDRSAWVVTAYDRKLKRLYFIDAFEGNLSLAKIEEQSGVFMEYYGVFHPRIEAVVAFDYVAQRIETVNKRAKCKRIRPKGNKKNRLISTSVAWEKGQVFVVKGNPHLKTMVDQLTRFGKTKHDDLMDAGTHAVEENLFGKRRGRARRKKRRQVKSHTRTTA